MISVNPFIFSYQPPSGLALYWKLAGNANDYSGNNNTGIISSGCSLVANHKGINNYAYKFDGTVNAKITSNNNVDLSGTDKISVAFWINLNSRSANQFLFNHNYNYPSYSNGFGMFVVSAFRTEFLQAKTPSRNWAIASSSAGDELFANTWYHVVWTIDRSQSTPDTEFNFYLNGIHRNHTSVAYASDLSGFFSSSQFVLGSIESYFNSSSFCELMLFNRELTAVEILDMYNKTK